MNKSLCFLGIALLISCIELFSQTNSMDMNLNGILECKWEDSITDVQISFNNNNYKNIKSVEDSISAEFDFNGFPSVVDIDYFNNKMYWGRIRLKSLEKIEKSEFYEIEAKLLQYLTKKYGEPERDEDKIEHNKPEDHNLHLIWKFKNNCSIMFGSSLSNKYSYLRTIVIAYCNESVFEEWMAENRHKEEEEKSQWFATNKELLKDLKDKLKITHDDFDDITWINSIYKDEGSILEKMYLYTGNSGCRLVINHNYKYDRYKGTLYIKEYRFNIDGINRNFKPNYDEIDVDNSSPYICFEFMDINIEDRKDGLYRDLTELLEEIANSKKTIIRFSGSSRYEDREITESEKQGIKTIMLAREYLRKGGKLKDIM
jgi:hypothetical protein